EQGELTPPPPPRFLHIHNVLGSAAVCENSHPLQGSFLYQCLCSDCLNTDLITIKWRLLWNGPQNQWLTALLSVPEASQLPAVGLAAEP
ncbi:hypothetical protein KUCAC02_022795, partial [Chaenocephalus aceratus]